MVMGCILYNFPIINYNSLLLTWDSMRMTEISIGNNYASKVIEILEFSENDLTHAVIWYLKTKNMKKITSELFSLLKLRTWKSRSKFHWNFFRLKKMAPWNATKECWTTFFFFYPLLWVLRLFLDFYALDQFINPSFLVLEAEHDQDINSRPKPRWLETKVRSSLFSPFKDQNLDLIMLI